jgi:hypothetical protein
MSVYFIPYNRAICENEQNAVALAVRSMGVRYEKDNPRFMVSSPVIVKHNGCPNRFKVVVCVYDTRYLTFKKKTRSIIVKTFDEGSFVQYFGNMGEVN